MVDTIKKTDRKRNVLFVDADKNLVEDLKDWIKKSEIEEKTGLKFTFVMDVKEAMAAIQKTPFDLVVTEIVLPTMNGYYLLKHLREKHKDLEIAIYTRLKSPQDLAKMASSGATNIFVKELMSGEDLINIIKNKTSDHDIDQIVLELNSQLKALHSNGIQTESKLIQCPRCNLIIAPDSHFCNNCGQRIFKKKKKVLQTSEADEKPEEAEKEENNSSQK